MAKGVREKVGPDYADVLTIPISEILWIIGALYDMINTWDYCYTWAFWLCSIVIYFWCCFVFVCVWLPVLSFLLLCFGFHLLCLALFWRAAYDFPILDSDQSLANKWIADWLRCDSKTEIIPTQDLINIICYKDRGPS